MLRVGEVLEQVLFHFGPGYNASTRHRVLFHAKIISLWAEPITHLWGQKAAVGRGWFAGQVCGEKR